MGSTRRVWGQEGKKREFRRRSTTRVPYKMIDIEIQLGNTNTGIRRANVRERSVQGGN